MQLSKRVALEEVIGEWQHMTELEKDLVILWVFLMFDKRSKWLMMGLVLTTLIFLAAAIIFNLPAQVFVSIGFAIGVLTVIVAAFVILTITKRR